MILLKSLTCILILLTLNSLSSAEILPEIQIVREDVKKIIAALYAGDVDTTLRYTHPKVVALLGGDTKAKAVLTTTLTKLKSNGMKVEVLSFPEEPVFIKTTKSEFVVVPTLMIIQANGQRVESLNYQFGARSVGSKEWTYIEGSRINPENVRQMFPEFPVDYKFPAFYRRKVQE